MTLSQLNEVNRLHTFLVLGRVSNLPTVWSNCVAGWLLGGGSDWTRFASLVVGATAIYLGGMFLNDAFDAAFDHEHRPERPIPAGWIKASAVWQWGLGLMAFGGTTLCLHGLTSAILTVLLAGSVLAYNAIHKRTPLAVLIMAACRFFLYLIASAAAGEIAGLAVWSGLALGVYITGLSLIARREINPTALPWWPLGLLLAPILLAWLANADPYRERAFGVSLLLTLWMLPFLRHLLKRPPVNPGFGVAGLLAGIVIVDLLAIAGGSLGWAFVFAALFLLALLAQRHIPAT